MVAMPRRQRLDPGLGPETWTPLSANASSPGRVTKPTRAPAFAAATAWFDPLPTGTEREGCAADRFAHAGHPAGAVRRVGHEDAEYHDIE